MTAQEAKRAFVTVLLALAAVYGLVLNINRDSVDTYMSRMVALGRIWCVGPAVSGRLAFKARRPSRGKVFWNVALPRRKFRWFWIAKYPPAPPRILTSFLWLLTCGLADGLVLLYLNNIICLKRDRKSNPPQKLLRISNPPYDMLLFNPWRQTLKIKNKQSRAHKWSDHLKIKTVGNFCLGDADAYQNCFQGFKMFWCGDANSIRGRKKQKPQKT